MTHPGLPPIPPEIQKDLKGEEVLFAVREPRLVSRSGRNGAIGFGLLLIAFGLIARFLIGAKNAVIEVPGARTTGDSAEGAAVFAILSVLGIVLGLAVIVTAVVSYRRPGTLAVGTATRYAFVGLRGVSWMSWKDVQSFSTDADDGTIHFLVHKHARSRWPGGAETIVGPPRELNLPAKLQAIGLRGDWGTPEGVMAKITKIREGPTADGPVRTFVATHRAPIPVGLRGRVLGLSSLALGAAVVLATSVYLLTGGTVLYSENDGPRRAIDGSEPMAWAPVLIGALFIAFSLPALRSAKPRRRATEYDIENDALVERYDNALPGRRYPWGAFAGHPIRTSTARGAEFSFPLARDGHMPDGPVLRIVGMQDADAFESEVQKRISDAR